MELTVEQLIDKLKKIENQQAKISILVNDRHPEDEESDKDFNLIEFWEDREDGVTLFIGLQTETII
jgi:hypothetical protein